MESHCHNHDKCIEKSLIEANEVCLEKNLRFTDLRKKVFGIISKNHKPVKAYDILSELQKEDPAAKPSTIYRTLDFLLESGLIHKLHSSNSYAACSHPNAKHSQCYFLICDKCNDIKECCNSGVITREIHNIADENSFKASNISIEIQGVCGECASLSG